MSDVPVLSDHTHEVHNGKRRLTIDELALQQPGMDRLMAELGPRMHRLSFAAGAGNWPLAQYFVRSVIKQLQACSESRPKYAEAMSAYLTDDLAPLREAVRARDLTAFRSAYEHAVRRGNDYHAEFGKPYIVWRCPAQAPEDLDLTAGMG